MNKLFVALLVFSMMLSGVYAKDIVLNGRGTTGIVITADQITNKIAPEVMLECTIEKMQTSVQYTEKGQFTTLSIPRFHSSATIGAPALPVMNQLIEVPFGAELVVSVEKLDEKEYTLNEIDIFDPIMPRQPAQPKNGTLVPFEYDQSAYVVDAFQQGDLVAIEDAGVMRNMRLAKIKISPVAYNPVSKKVKVYNNIKIKLTLKKSDMARTENIKKKYASPFFSSLTRKILVPNSLRSKNIIVGGAGYMIVADRMFEEALAPFIAWKTEKGFIVDVVYTDQFENITEELKTYIHESYNNPTAEKPAPTFVLFVGDNEQIPAFKGETGSHISDLYFVAVTSGDLIPDILTGRFSAKTVDQLLPQINKTLEYEKYTMPDKSFLEHVVMIAGWDYSHTFKWGWPQIKYGLKYYFNAAHGIKNTHVYLSSGSHQNDKNIIKDISAGCSYVNYTAHGSSTSWADPGLRIPDINNMKNKGKYPLVVGNCCLTNKFEVGTCFGEGWLRAKDKGAIGYIGGTNSTYWDEDLWWGAGYYSIQSPNDDGTPPDISETGTGAYDSVFTGDLYTNAGMMVAGNLAVEESNSSRKKYYWEVYLLMGDPSTMVYWGIPEANTVSHDTELKAGKNSILVKAKAGSYVGVSMDNEFLGAGYIDGSGKTAITLNTAKSGTAKVVVTGKNLEPYFGELKIVK